MMPEAKVAMKRFQHRQMHFGSADYVDLKTTSFFEHSLLKYVTSTNITLT
jgi:hypothetical protein